MPLSLHLTMRWCVNNCWVLLLQDESLNFALSCTARPLHVPSFQVLPLCFSKLLVLLLALLLLLPTPLLPPLLLWGLLFLLLAPLPLALLLLQMLGLLQAQVLLALLLLPLLPPLLLLPPGAPIPDCWP